MPEWLDLAAIRAKLQLRSSITGSGSIEDDLAALCDEVERLRALIARLPRHHYDTHGWFVCNACYAFAKSIRVRYADPQPDGAAGYLTPGPFQHKPGCPWHELDPIACHAS